MFKIFLFSSEQFVSLFIFGLFLYYCPKLTKNILPYSYTVEKIICTLLVIIMALEQLLLISSGNYSTLNSLPIGINYICIYLCIAILIFKQYHLFNIFFSWSLVCSVGELIFSKNLGYEFPSLIYFIFILSKCLIIYADIYMVDVRKFKVNRYALRDNLAICFIYFSFIFLLNTFTNSRYYYGFLSYSTTAIFTFIFVTSIMYIPALLFNRDTFILEKKKKSK
ncbi:YwaF family protein [Clostridioides difficile]|uniref:TMEM164 family acyltransferase n=1 Tax=Clostridioides difficile TaxID=1496 RepID=UPI001034426A|nr:YwaF family protein [Clostridioides difficile]